MPGAVILAATGALRAGAGKLQVATVRSTAPGVAVTVPEARVFGLAESAEGGIEPAAAPRWPSGRTRPGRPARPRHDGPKRVAPDGRPRPPRGDARRSFSTPARCCPRQQPAATRAPRRQGHLTPHAGRDGRRCAGGPGGSRSRSRRDGQARRGRAFSRRRRLEGRRDVYRHARCPAPTCSSRSEHRAGDLGLGDYPLRRHRRAAPRAAQNLAQAAAWGVSPRAAGATAGCARRATGFLGARAPGRDSPTDGAVVLSCAYMSRSRAYRRSSLRCQPAYDGRGRASRERARGPRTLCGSRITRVSPSRRSRDPERRHARDRRRA